MATIKKSTKTPTRKPSSPYRHRRSPTGPEKIVDPDAPKNRNHTSATTGPFCGAKRRSELGKGKLCRNPAGYKTDHVGQGRCKYHGGASPRKHGRYSKIIHRSVREAMDALDEVDTNVMDLEPEVKLLRALLVDFINRYEEMTEALLAWYADGEGATKPRRVLDVADAGRLVSEVSKIVERIHKMRSEGAISMETFRRVTEQMGLIVAKHVMNPKMLHAIEVDWANLVLDTKTFYKEDHEVEGDEDDDTDDD